MDCLDIKTLTTILRSFSNEITASGLASDFGVSYSTLARGNRTGAWPPSITEGAVRGTIDDYRDRFFGGDGEALAARVQECLRTMGLSTYALENALAEGGYDAFVAELVAQAHDPQPGGAVTKLIPAPARPAPSVRLETSAQPTIVAQPEIPRADNGPSRTRDLMLALPVAIVLLIGSLNVSIGDLFFWATHHRIAFFGISLGVAVLPALLGILVDAPIAWHIWHKNHPEAEFSWHAFRRVAKYGSPEEVVPGAGRFNLTLPYLFYQPVCNVLSMMCYVAELAFVLSLPGFEEFFCKHEWVEFLKASIAIAYYVAYEFTCDNWRRPLTGDPSTEVCENPDNYLPTRVHVWANIVHLTWTISILMVLLLAMLAWGISCFRSFSVPILILWPYVQAVVFFAFSSVTPYAVRVRATGVGVFLPGIAATSIAFSVYATVCFVLSTDTALLCAVCASCLEGTIIWVRHTRDNGSAEWLAQNRLTGAYAMAVTATILGMLVVGVATLAFA